MPIINFILILMQNKFMNPKNEIFENLYILSVPTYKVYTGYII